MNAVELRELRRQKILQNMDNRMKKITSVASAAEGGVSEIIASNPTLLDATPVWLHETEHHPVEEPSEQFVGMVKASEEVSDSQEWIPSQRQTESVPPASIHHKPGLQQLLKHNYVHTVLLALCTYLLLKFKFGYLIYDSAMVPFWTRAVADCAVRTREKNRGMVDMAIAAVTMFGISSQFLSILVGIFTLISEILRGLFIYIFFLAFFATVFGT